MIDHFGMDRRALMQRLLILAGAAALPGGTQALAAAAAKTGKRTLSPARYAVLTALADTIVPKTDTDGALAADVPAKLDAIIGIWANPEHKAEIIAAIDRIDVEAKAKHSKGFAALTAEERATFLTPYDIAALKAPPAAPAAPAVSSSRSTVTIGGTTTKVDPNYGKAKQEPAVPITRQMSPRATDPGYQRTKELIVVLYYISEIGLTQELTYEHAPGEWQPSVPVTPSTRPSGGLAAI